LDRDAVSKIYKIKEKPTNESLILLVHSVEQLKEYIVEVHPRIETLIHYHRRPISVVYQANKNLPDHLSDHKGNIAIRVTKDTSLCNIIERLGSPIVSTSANHNNSPYPKSYADISNAIRNNVDYILNPGRSNNGKPKSSMIISFDEEGELIFLRK
jgi:L-threonylcarbamoyladenylate synthase